MSPLEKLFEQTLPVMLRDAAANEASGVIGFAATGVLEQGYWVVSLAERTARRGTAADVPDVVVEADAAALALLLSGGLDVPRALDAGVLTVRGDRSKLMDFAQVFTKALAVR